MPNDIALIGLDIAKTIFHVHAADKEGRILFRRRLRREEVEPFFRDLPPRIVGLEACPGGHYWGRVIRDHGHDARLLPPQYVRPSMKANKNDAVDAEAICEASQTVPQRDAGPLRGHARRRRPEGRIRRGRRCASSRSRRSASSRVS